VRVAVTVVGRRRFWWVERESTSSVEFIMFGLDCDLPEVPMTDLNEIPAKLVSNRQFLKQQGLSRGPTETPLVGERTNHTP